MRAKTTMHMVKPKKKSLLIRVAVLALSVYIVVSFVQISLQIDESQRRLDELNAMCEEQENKNVVLQDKLDGYEEYLEQQARKQGMAKPGETILVEIPSE